jgi:YVTN family beta-propeller protein
MLLVLIASAGCMMPITAGDPQATETAIAAGILARLTAEAGPTETPTERATETTAARPTGPAPVCVVRVDGLNLRSGPGTAFAPPLGQLAAGTLLLPLTFTPVGDPDGRWVQVQAAEGAAVGWVAAGSVDCNIDLGTLPVAPLPSRVTVTPSPTATASPTARPFVSIALPPATLNGMAVDPERGYIFVAGRDTDKVYVVDPERQQIIKEIAVGRQPFGVTYIAGYIHVANFGSGSVTVIDPQTLSTLPLASTGQPAPVTGSIQNEISQPTFIAAEPASERAMVVLNGPQEVYHRHVYIYRVMPDLQLGDWASVNGLTAGSYGIATLTRRARAYVSNRDTQSLIALDTGSSEVVEAESLRGLPFVPYYVAAMDATSFVYVTHNAPDVPGSPPDRVSQFLAYSGAPQLMKTVVVGDLGDAGGFIGIYPWREDMMRPESPYDGSVWVGTPGKVTVFDPTLVALAEFGPEDGIGGRPYALAFDPVRRRACVAGAEANTITVLSGW